MTDDIATARAALLLAYEAGRWRGQVDLEMHYGREQYGVAFVEAVITRRKIPMPLFPCSVEGRRVTVSLRSDRWREGVANETEEIFERAFSILETILTRPQKQLFDPNNERTKE
jgi:hypothetical protein